jgi:hypothetical protein
MCVYGRALSQIAPRVECTSRASGRSRPRMADERAECFRMSVMSSRRGFWSDLKTGRWVVVPGKSRSLSPHFLLTLIPRSLLSSHSLGSPLVAYKLVSFHPSNFISSPA